jgi:hypothetical protein
VRNALERLLTSMTGIFWRQNALKSGKEKIYFALEPICSAELNNKEKRNEALQLRSLVV